MRDSECFPRVQVQVRAVPSPLLFSTKLDVPAHIVRQGKERQCGQTGKEKQELSLFADDSIICVENLKEWTKKKQKALLEPICDYSQVAGYMVNVKITCFLICQQ